MQIQAQAVKDTEAIVMTFGFKVIIMMHGKIFLRMNTGGLKSMVFATDARTKASLSIVTAAICIIVATVSSTILAA